MKNDVRAEVDTSLFSHSSPEGVLFLCAHFKRRAYEHYLRHHN